jgi:hypothetical protein
MIMIRPLHPTPPGKSICDGFTSLSPTPKLLSRVLFMVVLIKNIYSITLMSFAIGLIAGTMEKNCLTVCSWTAQMLHG